MSRVRDIANILSGSTDMATDAEVTSSIASHAAAADPHTGYILESLFDAKGDLIAASADNTPAKLTAGNNGDTLVADSSATTGLRWQSNFAAGKNKLINGDFNIWQRGTSFSGGTGYSADRWRYETGGGNWFTISQQALAANTLTGLTAPFFLQNVVSANSGSGDYGIFSQRIEDVRTFAGQTVTVSFWAKSASGTPKLGLEFYQLTNGTGGGSIPVGAITISTTWTRYTATVAIPSLSGATIAAGNFLEFTFWMTAGSSWNSRASSIGNQANTFSIAGVQVEAGSVATAFQTATGTLAGELAACQRYYAKTYNQGVTPGTATANGAVVGFQLSTTQANAPFVNWNLPVEMRTTPTLTGYSKNSGASGKMSGGSTDYNFATNGAVNGTGRVCAYPAGTIPAIIDCYFQITAEAEL